jgi:hypothetical protein
MQSSRDIMYKAAHAEIQAGEIAKQTGNFGKARVCARRGCFFAISYWLDFNPHKDWGDSAMIILTKLQKDDSIPVNIRDAAQRLTKKVDKNYETGIDIDPLKDGEIIIEYFLGEKNLKEI